MKNAALQSRLKQMVGYGSEKCPELERAYFDTFTSSSGQLVLEDLKNRGYVFAPAPDQIAEGARRLVLHIGTMMQPEPEETAS